MLKFSANLNFLFTEYPFLDRFQAAAKAGFRYVEFMFPYAYSLAELKKRLEENDLSLVLINLPAGDWDGGDRGLATDPNRKREFREGVPKGAEAAAYLGVPRVNCLVGKAPGGFSSQELENNLLENLDYAAWELAKANLLMNVEPVNSIDVPGFFLNTADRVISFLERVHHDNVYLQYDIYHEAQEKQDWHKGLQKYFARIGHVQIADHPGRHEPGSAEIDFSRWLKELEELKYKGFVGLEYKPSAATESSLAWLEKYGYLL